MRSFSETEKPPKSIIYISTSIIWKHDPLANQTSGVLMQYDHKKKYFTYCDNHTHQLKTSITYTKKIKTITFIGPVHHTHRNIFNINFYRTSTSHTHRETFPTKTFIGSVHHTHRNIFNINFYRTSTSHTHRETFPTKTFIGPVHHTQRNISNINFYRASTSHTEKHFQHKLL